jgi:hypothetical protein
MGETGVSERTYRSSPSVSYSDDFQRLFSVFRDDFFVGSELDAKGCGERHEDVHVPPFADNVTRVCGANNRANVDIVDGFQPAPCFEMYLGSRSHGHGERIGTSVGDSSTPESGVFVYGVPFQRE